MSFEVFRHPFAEAAGACFEALDEALLPRADKRLDLPALRRRITDILARLEQRAKDRRICDSHLEHARFALVATVDEMVLCSDLPGKLDWLESPLQLSLFGEHAAGERFFVRLDRIHAEQAPAGPLLELYLACLQYGFRGRYRLSGEQALPEIRSRLLERIAAAGPADDRGNGFVGQDRRVRTPRGALRPGPMAVVCFAGMVITWAAASFVVGLEQQNALDDVVEAEASYRDVNIGSMLEEERDQE